MVSQIGPFPINTSQFAGIGTPRLRPTITNGGSVTIKSVPFHLRPRASEGLHTGALVAMSSVTEPIRVTWTATARNRNGVLQDELRLPIAEPTDISDLLAQ